MQNWRKKRNFRKHKNADGSFTYTITVDGESVEVCEALYRAYATSARKMEYMELDLKRDRTLQDEYGRTVTDVNGLPIALPEREISLDKLLDEDWDFSESDPLPDDVLIKSFEFNELRRCIALLNTQEQALIKALFFDGISETQYAAQNGISQPAVSKRRKAVLTKLKKLIKI